MSDEKSLMIIPQNDAEVADWLAALANEEAKHERVGGSVARIELDGVGGFRFVDGGDPVQMENPFLAVILGDRLENRYYSEGFRKDSDYRAPDCFAIHNGDESEMVPHPSSAKKQNDDCASCPLNQFGTAKQGDGKACSNRRRIALVGFDENLTEHAKIALMNLPPTIKADYAKFKKQLDVDHHRPTFACVTELHGSPGDKVTKVRYEMHAPIDKRAALEVLYDLKVRSNEMLDRPYDPTPEGSGAPKKKKGRVRMSK